MKQKKTKQIDVRKIYRIIDANLNRSKEALRVCEDLYRFYWNDQHISKRIKTLRHKLTRIFLSLDVPYEDLLMSRDAAKDVGKRSFFLDKVTNISAKDIRTANLKRSQESVRVLEEVAKTLSPKIAKQLQGLRFDLYELERKSFQ